MSGEDLRSPADTVQDELYRGLQALADSAFPKRCNTCGRHFADAAAFVAETARVAGQRSGLKATHDDDGKRIVELYRNCPCGSTLMDSFSDRRDLTEAGLRRRTRFGELLAYLVGKGLPGPTARAELLKVLRGEHSEVLASFRPPPAGAP